MRPLIIIVGGGIAGLTAAARCVSWQVPILLVEQQQRLGGQLWWINNKIRDYPGVEANTGSEFCLQVLSQIHLPREHILLNQQVTRFLAGSEHRLVLCDGRELTAPVVIAATGASRRIPVIPGISDVDHDRVSMSATTDRELAAGEAAAVVGGGDGAAENAIILARRSKHVHLICRSTELRARRPFREAILNTDNISLHLSATVREVFQNKLGLVLRIDTLNGLSELVVAGVVFKLGFVPNSQGWTPPVQTNPRGFIVANQNGKTNVPGLFATGDVNNESSPSIAAAVGQGAIAAHSAYKYLRHLGYDV